MASSYWADSKRHKQRQRYKMVECDGCGCLTFKNALCARCNTWNGPQQDPEGGGDDGEEV